MDAVNDGNQTSKTKLTGGHAMAAVMAVEKWFRVNEVMKITGFGRSFLYGQMDAGTLRSKKVGGARVIPESALIEFQQRFDGNGEISQ